MNGDFSRCSDIIQDTDGNYFSLSGKALVHTYNGLGQRLTTTASDGTNTWVYTWTYDAVGNNETESGWVAQ